MRSDHGGAFGARIDASVNCNPLGPPRSLDPVFARVRDLAARYPDLDARRARHAWATALGVPLERLLVGNGASELIAVVTRALSPARVVLFEPCYSEYAAAADAAGAPVAALRLERTADAWLTPLAALAPRPGDLVVLGHPNNPTAHLLDPTALRAVAAAHPESWFLVDESFLPFHPAHDDLTLLRDRPANLAVVRSLTKIFCVPGLRLGLLVADEALVAASQRLRDPWAVNAIAADAAVVLASEETAAALPGSYLDRTRSWLAAETPRALESLRAAGLAAWRADAPYVLAELPEPLRVADLAASLSPLGIAVRDASTFVGLTPRTLRVGLRFDDETDEIVAAIADFLAT